MTAHPSLSGFPPNNSSGGRITQKEANRRWYGRNQLHQINKAKAWRKANPGYQTAWRKANPEKAKRIARECNLKYYYGLTGKQKDEMAAAQGNRCKYCRNKFKNSRDRHVDHVHGTNPPIVRGILCGNCNKGIGLLKDNTTVMRRAMKDIDSWAKVAAGQQLNAVEHPSDQKTETSPPDFSRTPPPAPSPNIVQIQFFTDKDPEK